MKKIIAILIFCTSFLTVNPVLGQGSALLNSYDYLSTYQRERNSNEEKAIKYLIMAKEEIDGAIKDPGTKGESRTWKRRGDIYYTIATDKSVRLVLYREGAKETAKESYLKALFVEKRNNGKPKIDNKAEIFKRLDQIASSYNSNASGFFEDKKFKKAYNSFMQSLEIYNQMAKVDPDNESIAKAAKSVKANMLIAALNGGVYDKYIPMAKAMIDKGSADTIVYKNLARAYLETDSTDKAAEVLAAAKQKYPNAKDIILAQISLAFKQGKNTQAMQLIAEGKSKFPKEKADFILQEINYYLSANKNAKAAQSIEQAISTFKDNKKILKVLAYNAGVIYSNIANKGLTEGKPQSFADSLNKKSIKYYKLAIQADSTFADAYSGVGTYYVEQGNKLTKEASSIPLDNQSAYKAKIDEAKTQYKKAAKYLEKSYALEPDSAKRQNLMAIYTKLKNYERIKELQQDQLNSSSKK